MTKMVIKLSSTLADLLTRNVSMAGPFSTLNLKRTQVSLHSPDQHKTGNHNNNRPRMLYLKKGFKKASKKSAHMAIQRGGHKGIVSARDLFAEYCFTGGGQSALPGTMDNGRGAGRRCT